MQVESAPPGKTDSIQEGPGNQKTVMPLANTQNYSGDILLCLAYPSLHGWTFQVTADSSFAPGEVAATPP